MMTLKSPSNRITAEIIGTEPLDINDRMWLADLADRLDKRLREVAAGK